MSSDEIESLRDQVRRLNAVLFQYQQKYPGYNPDDKQVHEVASGPWQEDHKIISPLLREYDSRIEELSSVVENTKQEHRNLRQELDELVVENARLTQRLKDSLQLQLETTDTGTLGSETPGDEQVVVNLQEQLQEAAKEKESATQMWRQAMTELERLQHVLASTRPNAQVAAWEAQATKIQDQFKSTVGDLTNENSILQEELRQTRTQQHAAQLQVMELRATLEDMKSRLKWQEQEKSFVSGSKKKADTQLSALHQQQTELDSLYHEAKRKVSLLEREKAALEDRVIMLKKKMKEGEDVLLSFQRQVREGMQLVEAACLEKDQVVEREKQASEEVDRLNTVINKLLDQAGARTREEVDSVKQQCNQNIRRLMDELETLETNYNEKQSQLDRAVRDKRAVESELEKVQKKGLEAHNTEQLSLLHSQQRAFDAEQKREEALLKVDNLQQQMRRLNMSHDQEAEQLKSEIDQLNQRLSDLTRSHTLLTDERVTLLEQIDQLKTRVHKLQIERDSALREKSKEIILMEKELSEQTKEYEVKLEALEDSHRRTVEELRQMLNAQQRLSAKWKEECNTITQACDRKLKDAKEELQREKRRGSDLSRLLKTCTGKMSEAQHTLGEYSEQIQRMEERLRLAESRSSHSSETALGSKYSSKNVLEKRKQLQRELEKSLKEIKESSSQSGTAL